LNIVTLLDDVLGGNLRGMEKKVGSGRSAVGSLDETAVPDCQLPTAYCQLIFQFG